MRHTRNFHSDAASNVRRQISRAVTTDNVHHLSTSPSPPSERSQASPVARQDQDQSHDQTSEENFSQEGSRAQSEGEPRPNHSQRKQLIVDPIQGQTAAPDQPEGRTREARLELEPEQCQPPDHGQCLRQHRDHDESYRHQEQFEDLQIMPREMGQASVDYSFDFELLEFPAADFMGISSDILTELPTLSPIGLPHLTAPIISETVHVPMDNLFADTRKRSPPFDHAAPNLRPSTSPSTHNTAYARALANLHMCDPDHAESTFRFPSERIVNRFVDAFFRHMAPHMPILHQPTFTIATTPCKYILDSDERY